MGSPLIWIKMRRKLIRAGYPVYMPGLSYQTASFDISARKLEQFIVEQNLKDIYIIGHSAGGIIATQMGYKGRDRIKKCFAISTPFHGSILSLFIFFIPAGRQMIPGSTFLKNNEINFMTFPNLQCLYSRFDLLIIPGFQGKLGRSDDIEYPGLGHINVIMSNSGSDFIMEKLELEDNKDEKTRLKNAEKKNKARVPEKTENKKRPTKAVKPENVVKNKAASAVRKSAPVKTAKKPVKAKSGKKKV